MRFPKMATAAVLDLVSPATCLGCDAIEPVDEESLCRSCRIEVAGYLLRNYCRGCGATVGEFGAADAACSQCRSLEPRLRFSQLVRCGPYEGRIRDLLVNWKFRGVAAADRFFARCLAGKLEASGWLESVDALVAVPTCWHRRLRGKPYIATELSRLTATIAGCPARELLRRVRGGPSQMGLTRTQRAENVRNAFRLVRGVRLRDAVLCLVDDVSTTGATLNECARVLLRAGAKTVYAAVACKQSETGAP
jgi:ComF family protein